MANGLTFVLNPYIYFLNLWRLEGDHISEITTWEITNLADKNIDIFTNIKYQFFPLNQALFIMVKFNTLPVKYYLI